MTMSELRTRPFVDADSQNVWIDGLTADFVAHVKLPTRSDVDPISFISLIYL